MKIQVKEQTERENEIEIEIEVPFYCKNMAHHYKVTGKGCYETISVTAPSVGAEIALVSPPVAFFNDWEKCTESEFLEAYEEAKKELEKLKKMAE